ncbi:hypothetical protein HQ489_03470 [Candidatus Woesearchaeota archaeon]|jgi:hypothetical protein|nr:hypothetical protein [Candidatus Woesearchaeota archaeon]
MTSKKLSKEQFYKELAEAKKDPQFRKDIRAFIKASTSVYKLKDYGMENL